MKTLALILLITTVAGAGNLSRVTKIAKSYRGHQTVDTKAEYRELESAIAKYSKKYRIPHRIVYAICETESGFRYKLNHRWVKTATYMNGKWKRRRTRAVGLGGVIYYSNPHVLKKIGLAPSDLYSIKYNVAAICAVLRYKMDRIQRGAKRKISGSRLLRKGLRAYYGGGGYADKVIRRSRRYL